MRGTDDQVNIILRKAEDLRERRRIRRQMAGSAAAAVFCLVLIPVTLSVLSGAAGSESEIQLVRYGSLVLATARIGYVLTGILAFLAGMFVMFSIRKYRELAGRMRERK